MNYWSRAIRDGDGVPRAGAPRPAAHRPARPSSPREARRPARSTRDDAPEDIAERLLGLIDGFSLHALLDPQRLTRERQVALVRAGVRPLSMSHSATPSHQAARGGDTCVRPDRGPRRGVVTRAAPGRLRRAAAAAAPEGVADRRRRARRPRADVPGHAGRAAATSSTPARPRRRRSTRSTPRNGNGDIFADNLHLQRPRALRPDRRHDDRAGAGRAVGRSPTDGKTYTFHLRPGVKFSNGQPVTAAGRQVVSLDRFGDPKINAADELGRGRLRHRRRSSTTRRCRSTLTQPVAAFLYNI